MALDEKVSFIVFVGHATASPVEQTLALAGQAVALDTIEKALSLEACERVIVATDSVAFAARLTSLPVIVEIDDEPFHFGKRLRFLIHKHAVQRPFYIGGGSAPLLSATDMARICDTLLAEGDAVISNNYYSADFAAFTPGSAIDRIEPPDTDNNLAYSLHNQAGLRNCPLPQSAGTLMDVDTPTDLMVLKLHPSVERHTRDFLDHLDLDSSNLDAALSVMNDSNPQLIVAGRIGAQAWAHLERHTACRTRVFSEERGMRASGREGTGQVKSLLGSYIEHLGVARFFEMLSTLGDAALIDSRVLFEHFGLRLPAADRYNSDLMRPEDIEDPFVREFTAEAKKAPIPVVLGGHSIVAGGIWALVEAAMAARSRS